MVLKIGLIKNVAVWQVKLAKFLELKKKDDKDMAKVMAKVKVARVASGNSGVGANLLSTSEEQQLSLPPMMIDTTKAKGEQVADEAKRQATKVKNINKKKKH